MSLLCPTPEQVQLAVCAKANGWPAKPAIYFGSVSPEGEVVGFWPGDLYWDEEGEILYVFNGTPGSDSGWVAVSGGDCPQHTSGEGDPTGEAGLYDTYTDTLTDALWVYTAEGWAQVGGGGGEALFSWEPTENTPFDFAVINFGGAWDEPEWNNLTSFTYQGQALGDGDDNAGQNIIFEGNYDEDPDGPDKLESFHFPNLTTFNRASVYLGGHASLTQIDLGNLQVFTYLSIELNTSLSNFALPALTAIGNPSQFTFAGNGCALSEASVNGLLVKFDSLGLSAGTINLSGGTNAAPSGDGITAKDALILAGVTVTTN